MGTFTKLYFSNKNVQIIISHLAKYLLIMRPHTAKQQQGAGNKNSAKPHYTYTTKTKLYIVVGAMKRDLYKQTLEIITTQRWLLV